MNVLKQVGAQRPVSLSGSLLKDERYQTLCRLLDANRYLYHIEHSDRKRTNHLSHMLVALYKLGASEQQLDEAIQLYRKRVPLVPAIPSTCKVNTSNWNQFVGKRSDYMDLIEFFMGELDKRELSDVLGEYLPVLMEGVSGHAFHGVIQLGYGIEAQYLPTIAEGLAYFTHAFTSLGKLDDSAEGIPVTNLDDAFAILESVRTDQRLNSDATLKTREGFLARLEYLLEHYGTHLVQYDLAFPSHVAEDIENLLSLFSLLTVKVFASEGCRDFFLLHLVTGMRALKVTLREATSLPEEDTLRALRYFWRAALYAYIVEGSPKVFNIDRVSVDKLSNWDCLADFKASSADVAEGHEEGEEEEEHVDIYFHPTMKDTTDAISGVKRGPKTIRQLRHLAIAGNDSHLAKVVFVCLEEAEEIKEKEGGGEIADFYHTAACATLERYSALGWGFRKIPESNAAPTTVTTVPLSATEKQTPTTTTTATTTTTTQPSASLQPHTHL